ncbi:hypothetical protein [Dyadobacter sp. MSC1_007]|jgi:hypothetical protein|uniref:hypothetical protein n=1 Tax=Dyadobacter sp. MSC1_007 TaxID=2909264 RepID=UPI00203006CC|nr:hypothetical protein [Dyadobacter sp. MSC1_007]
MIHSKFIVFCVLICAMPLCVIAQSQKTELTALPGFEGIKGRITDAASHEPMSARIIIKDTTGKLQATYYEHCEGIFTEEDGTFELPLKPGTYTAKVIHGIDYLAQDFTFTIREGIGTNAHIVLEPWIDLKKRGWINGDGHAHLYSDKPDNDTMLRQVRKICLAQGVDFISACQGWAGYTDSTWQKAYAKVSDGRFRMFYGAEMPKYRTSHVWWLGLKSTLNNFGNLIDSTYETQYYQSDQNTSWDYSWLKFKSIPDLEVIARYSKTQNALAIIPHPTSYWWQQRGNISKYTTNVVSNLSFGLLSGNPWSGMAVMGYMYDNYFYQDIWFHILNEGYMMSAFSELDGGYPRDNKFWYGSMRTYFQTDTTKNLEPVQRDPVQQVTEAAQKGRTFVTSGPIVFADIDGQFGLGDIVRANAQGHELNIQAYASGDPDDFLTYVVLFRNGSIAHLWDLRKYKSRRFKTSHKISEEDNAWYVVKVYGRNTWENPRDLDVLAFCRRAERSDSLLPFAGGKRSVAFTSPIYFRKTSKKPPQPLIARTDIKVVSPSTGKGVKNCTVEVFLAGEQIGTVKLNHGKGRLHIPPNALLKIKAEGFEPITRSLYADYEPYLKIQEGIANGHWLDQKDWKHTLNKGHVPWEAFQFEKTKKVLSRIKWKIRLEPNERDGLWKDFDALFSTKSK